jgi:DNA-directed RNA polymerase beta subunit
MSLKSQPLKIEGAYEYKSRTQPKGLNKVFVNFAAEFCLTKGMIKLYDEMLDNLHLLLDVDASRVSIEPPLESNPGRAPIPLMTNVAYKKDLTYHCTIMIDGKRYLKIPAMVGSRGCNLRNMTDDQKIEAGECYLEPGGFFIVGGKRKTINLQEYLASSQIITHKNAEGGSESEITCSLDKQTVKIKLETDKSGEILFVATYQIHGKSNIYLIFSIIIKYSGYDEMGGAEIIDTVNDLILTHFNSVDESSVRFILKLSELKFKAEDVESSIRLSYDENLKMKQQQIKPTQDEFFSKFLSNIFPHVQGYGKIQALAYMVARTIKCQLELRRYDNRDDYGNKRLDDAGASITKLLAGYMSGVKKNGERISSDDIEKYLITSFNPGSWGVNLPKSSSKRDNITDNLIPQGVMSYNSQITRISTPMSRETKNAAVRAVHSSQLGFICPYKTPDADGCGLIKNLSSTCVISGKRDPVQFLTSVTFESEDGVQAFCELNEDGFYFYGRHITLNQDLSLSQSDGGKLFMVNGYILGYFSLELLPILKRLKHTREFYDVCILFNPVDDCIEVYTDGSRVCRPLLTVDEDGTLPIKSIERYEEMDPLELVILGCVEFVHAKEQEFIFISQSEFHLEGEMKKWLNRGEKNYLRPTHCEIHPSAIFSISSATCPLGNMNESARVSYQSNMNDQALSSVCTNLKERFDTSFKCIITPTQPIFQTDMNETSGLNSQPNGETLTCALIAMKENNEDSGVGKSEYFKRRMRYIKFITIVVMINPSSSEILGVWFNNNPQAAGKVLNESKYHAIHLDGESAGLPRIGSTIVEGDKILSKYEFTKGQYSMAESDRSVTVGIGESGVIDSIHITSSMKRTGPSQLESKKKIMIRVRQEREQGTGDKVTARYSQKGTWGQILPERQLPRVKYGPNKGVVPDAFISPLSQPSRMTLAMPFELFMSKAALYNTDVPYVDATSFQHEVDIQGSIDTLSEVRRKWAETHPEEVDEWIREFGEGVPYLNKFHLGKEVMCHPDGRTLAEAIDMGPMHYQVLRHHQIDKFQLRCFGSVDTNRQPVKGRSNEGGTKVGEMEKDGLLSHGAMYTTQERLLTSSDAAEIDICTNCGNVAVYEKVDNVIQAKCSICSVTYRCENKTCAATVWEKCSIQIKGSNCLQCRSGSKMTQVVPSFGRAVTTGISNQVLRMPNGMGFNVTYMTKRDD